MGNWRRKLLYPGIVNIFRMQSRWWCIFSGDSFFVWSWSWEKRGNFMTSCVPALGIMQSQNWVGTGDRKEPLKKKSQPHFFEEDSSWFSGWWGPPKHKVFHSFVWRGWLVGFVPIRIGTFVVSHHLLNFNLLTRGSQFADLSDIFQFVFFVQFEWETELDDIGNRFGSRIPILVPGSAWTTMGTKLQGIFLRRKLWYPMMVDDLIQLGKCLLRSTFGQWKKTWLVGLYRGLYYPVI